MYSGQKLVLLLFNTKNHVNAYLSYLKFITAMYEGVFIEELDITSVFNCTKCNDDSLV